MDRDTPFPKTTMASSKVGQSDPTTDVAKATEPKSPPSDPDALHKMVPENDAVPNGASSCIESGTRISASPLHARVQDDDGKYDAKRLTGAPSDAAGLDKILESPHATVMLGDNGHRLNVEARVMGGSESDSNSESVAAVSPCERVSTYGAGDSDAPSDGVCVRELGGVCCWDGVVRCEPDDLCDGVLEREGLAEKGGESVALAIGSRDAIALGV